MTSLDTIPMENNYSPQIIHPSTDPASATHSGSYPCSSSSAMSHSSSHLSPAYPAQCSSVTSWGHTDPPSGELQGAEEDAEEERRNQTRTEEVSPTLPLTRTQTNSSAAHSGAPPIRVEDTTNTEEEDIADTFWHPLRDDGKVRVQNHEEDEGGEIDSVHALESIHDDDRASEGEEKEQQRRFKSSSSKAERLRLEFKPVSPLPWDAVDSSGQNNDPVVSDYYSTLNSKNFAALQKKCVLGIRVTLRTDYGCTL
ncbi:hypothetical protein PAXRUDRAFT_564188 [Paxillus rubicundulus Ve08.2h10]|uniref:Uncharacterized protein n=1 Tax=Paxillus rubicundulus Ve08.2h10 TaxID=930991 RepID=A0A0D0DVW9_9AGAM|nr:hypothetical protein PAXRUDRAFT_564188 [Paxillus rubicundulus Ve08.2h10]